MWLSCDISWPCGEDVQSDDVWLRMGSLLCEAFFLQWLLLGGVSSLDEIDEIPWGLYVDAFCCISYGSTFWRWKGGKVVWSVGPLSLSSEETRAIEDFFSFKCRILI